LEDFDRIAKDRRPTTEDCIFMITDALHKLANHRQALSRDEARAVMTEILSGQTTDAQIAALLVAMHMKGETVEEIVGFAEAIRAAAAPFNRAELNGASALDVSGTERDALVDTCGTGGDASGTFNISTATALTVAGAGVRVAKHGNRSVTSKCGSADVMEALGVNINLPAPYNRIKDPQTITVSGVDLRVMGGMTSDDWTVVGQSMNSVYQARGNLIQAELLIGPVLLLVVFLGALTIGRRVAARVVGRGRDLFTGLASSSPAALFR